MWVFMVQFMLMMAMVPLVMFNDAMAQQQVYRQADDLLAALTIEQQAALAYCTARGPACGGLTAGHALSNADLRPYLSEQLADGQLFQNDLIRSVADDRQVYSFIDTTAVTHAKGGVLAGELRRNWLKVAPNPTGHVPGVTCGGRLLVTGTPQVQCFNGFAYAIAVVSGIPAFAFNEGVPAVFSRL